MMDSASSSYARVPVHAHAVLAEAMRAAPASDWPRRVHLDGPRPVVSTRGMARITTRCAEQARERLTGVDGSRSDEILGLCRRSLAGHDISADRVAAAAQAGLTDTSPFALVARAALACWYAKQGPDSPTLGLGVTTDTVRRLVRVLQHEGRGTATFLRELDEQLMIDEVEASIRKYGGKPLHVKNVLWRRDRGNGTAGHFLCELEAGDYGVITKLKHRYRFERGPLDDMLSVLPEPLFEEAVNAVF